MSAINNAGPTEIDNPVSKGSGTLSTSRAVDVLFYLMNNDGEAGVSEISRALKMSKAVVYRILQSFVEKGLLEAGERPRREYRVGYAAALLGALASPPFEGSSLHSVSMPHLREMAEVSTETATVSALVGTFAVHIDQVPSQRELRMIVKTRVPRPLTIGASSKAILAFLGDAERKEVTSRVTPGSFAYPRNGLLALTEELEVIRNSRVAVSFSERERESAAVASPVFDKSGVVGAVSICGLVTRFTPEQVATHAELVSRASQSISKALQQS